MRRVFFKFLGVGGCSLNEVKPDRRGIVATARLGAAFLMRCIEGKKFSRGITTAARLERIEVRSLRTAPAWCVVGSERKAVRANIASGGYALEMAGNARFCGADAVPDAGRLRIWVMGRARFGAVARVRQIEREGAGGVLAIVGCWKCDGLWRTRISRHDFEQWSDNQF